MKRLSTWSWYIINIMGCESGTAQWIDKMFGGLVHHFFPNGFILAATGWIDVKCCAETNNTHGSMKAWNLPFSDIFCLVIILLEFKHNHVNLLWLHLRTYFNRNAPLSPFVCCLPLLASTHPSWSITDHPILTTIYRELPVYEWATHSLVSSCSLLLEHASVLWDPYTQTRLNIP